jgi:hypothetical protein
LPRLRGIRDKLFLQRAQKRASTLDSHKIRRKPKRKTIHKLKIAWRLCYARKPFRDLVPECEPQKGANWRLTKLDAKAAARIQQANLDTPVTCPRSIFYTKLLGIAQEENQKKLTEVHKTGILGPVGTAAPGAVRRGEAPPSLDPDGTKESLASRACIRSREPALSSPKAPDVFRSL